MSIDFSTLTGLTIPEGEVTKIQDAAGNVLWELVQGEPIEGNQAILYSDGALVFYNGGYTEPEHGDIVNTYTGWDTTSYSYSSTPWYSDRESIINVVVKDGVIPNSTGYWFNGCSNIVSFDLSGLDTSRVADMTNMFSGCSSVMSLDVSNFDTTNVTMMSMMFDGMKKLTSLDLSDFNTSNVVYMQNMFYGCSSLISLDLSSFNTSEVVTMANMFDRCSKLISLDMSGFDTPKVANMSYMFRDCSASGFTIYVGSAAMKTWVESTSNFPSTATVVVGSM